MAIFPTTQEFHLVTGDFAQDQVATMHVTRGDFEDMMTDIANHALMQAKLRGVCIQVYSADFASDEVYLPCLNAYPKGYTEVYR